MRTLHRLLTAFACGLGLLTMAPTADAGPASKPGSKPSTRAGAKRVKPAGPKVTYANGDSEAQRQRREEARLRRECKGRPNAGACLGYTR
ncbi:hypothetical protein [Ottowia sp.]|uniref:hypothetical protein n=1 Tax=Ottowia sp. TaxID=1898956 RepID=UPI002C5807BD|nr:hypothetical protein [Ottowia sp.]HRN74360.1 hypothetical protein [Ottowia sp.]HRQ01280.1 hypothetical protein [Ottowia sp.]